MVYHLQWSHVVDCLYLNCWSCLNISGNPTTSHGASPLRHLRPPRKITAILQENIPAQQIKVIIQARIGILEVSSCCVLDCVIGIHGSHAGLVCTSQSWGLVRNPRLDNWSTSCRDSGTCQKLWRNLESVLRPQEVIMDHPVFNDGFSWWFFIIGRWSIGWSFRIQCWWSNVQYWKLRHPDLGWSRDLMDLGHPGTHIVSSRTIKAVRKDVLAKCYGGDISRLSVEDDGIGKGQRFSATNMVDVNTWIMISLGLSAYPLVN